MPIVDFLAHINDPAPAFACHFAGDQSQAVGWTARVTNQLNAPASASSLAKLHEWLGSLADPFQELYQVHDGLLLYEDVNLEVLPSASNDTNEFERAAGIELYPILEWPGRSETVLEDPLSFGWDEEEIAKWKHSSLLFGEICDSDNYFAVRTKGLDSGTIYYLQHDPSIDGPIAANFEELLDRVVADPADFLNSMGCYTRYHDGQTDKQWIPKAYIPNADH